MLLETVSLDCPYCGQTFTTTADLSGGSQQYIEDCPVCCRPVECLLEVGANGELLSLDVRRDDE